MAFTDFFRERLPQKIVGILFTLVTAGWAGYITMDQGVINPDRPMNYDHVYAGMVGFYAEKQDSANIASEAKADGDISLRAVMEGLSREVDERIALHKSLAVGQAPVPPGHSTDMRAFATTVLPKLPPECNVSIKGIQPRTILYSGTDSMEILCSSQTGAEALFDQYVAKMVELKWLVQFPSFHNESRRGVLIAKRENYTLFIRVDESRTFPDSPTFIYWLLESDAYIEDYEY